MDNAEIKARELLRWSEWYLNPEAGFDSLVSTVAQALREKDAEIAKLKDEVRQLENEVDKWTKTTTDRR